MKNYFLALLLICASACRVAVPYTSLTPTYYYAIKQQFAYRQPDASGPAAFVVAEGESFKVIGYYFGWDIARIRGRKYFVRADIVNIVSRNESSSAYDSAPSSPNTDHETYTGPRGGQYYYNGKGNKQYITPQSTYDRELIQTGPRGGQYYINGNGHKTYIKH